jgi:hypothetical protein
MNERAHLWPRGIAASAVAHRESAAQFSSILTAAIALNVLVSVTSFTVPRLIPWTTGEPE